MRKYGFTILLLAILTGTQIVLSSSRKNNERESFYMVEDSLTTKIQTFVFVTRNQYASGHHNSETFFPATENEFNDGQFKPGGALKLIDFKTGSVTTLLSTEEGVIRDPEIHFDAKKILFSMRKNKDDSYHIHEINIDGTGLRQLTFMKDVDDIDPFYLADDHIAFSSTREPKYCGCNRHIMANLYRMEPDGSNIYQISKNLLFDGHGSLMPDGRILYDRWEYVDRNYGDAQSLWTCNPDGTNHALYWGNNTPSPGGVIDARIIPENNKALCVFSSCHDRPWGAIAMIDRQIGLEGPKPVVKIWPDSAMQYVWESDYMPYFGIDNMARLQKKYEDPYPLNEQTLICSGQVKTNSNLTGLFLLDTLGNEQLLYAEEQLGSFDPIPLVARQRPPVIPVRRNLTDSTGFFYVLNVYEGTHMQDVKQGDVKYLRVIEVPEKRFWTKGDWHGQGSMYPAMNWDDFQNKKILGTVPVNDDGSTYFEVPSEKFVYFQLLDKDGMMIQSMRSGTMVQPGEQNGCIGCHDNRLVATASSKPNGVAFMKKPLQLQSWHGKTGTFSYREEVQPVFDRYCIKCHQPGSKAGTTLNLTGGTAQIFNPSYAELWGKKYIRPIGAGPARMMPARSWGASASKLIDIVQKNHADVHLDSLSMDKLITWIDLNAPYYPSYATSYPNNPFGRSPLTYDESKRLKELTGINVTPGLSDSGNMYYDAPNELTQRDKTIIFLSSILNFDEPEKSEALRGLKEKDPKKYEESLQIIFEGSKRIQANGNNDFFEFKACTLDEWRDKKYIQSRKIEQENRKSIVAGEKKFDIVKK